MRHEEFIGQVQSRARLGSRGAAERATRATLETLAERIPAGLAEKLAAQLPHEIAEHLRRIETLRYGDPDTSSAEGDSVPTTLRQLDGTTVTTACDYRSLPAYSTLLTEAGFPEPAVDLPTDPAESRVAPYMVLTAGS